MSEPQTMLGKLIEGDAGRDAIHIAVAPVIAGVKLMPGDHIGFSDGGTETVAANVSKRIGIVDPFLPKAVQPGERFFMFLYPNTITALRHVWTHPAFAAEDARVGNKEASEAWLRAFVERSNCPEYETVIAAAVGAALPSNGDDDDYNSASIRDGYLHFSGRDASGEIPPEFWDHVAVVTGKKITKRPEYFSCSC